MDEKAAIAAFNAALRAPGRMGKPTPREIAAQHKTEKVGFKKHVRKNAPKKVTAPASKPEPRPEYEPYVHIRGEKKGYMFRYKREIPGVGMITAGFKTKEAANRFARVVNNIYRSNGNES